MEDRSMSNDLLTVFAITTILWLARVDLDEIELSEDY